MDKNTKINSLVWLYNYIVLNSILYAVVGISFFLNNASTNALSTNMFLLVADIGHLGFMPLVALPILLLLNKLIRIKNVVLLIGGILYSFGLIFIIVDALVYAQMRFHLNKFVFDMVFSSGADEIFHFAYWMYLVAFTVITLIVLSQILFARISIKCVAKSMSRKFAFIAVLVFMLSSHFIFAVSNAMFYHPITQVQRVFPLYFPLTANSLLNNLGLVDRDKLRERKALENTKSNGTLFYPNKKLEFETAPNYNVLIILIDCWRGDCMTPEITPNVAKIAEQSQVFTNHYSGSSGTRSGVFSLFYSLPAFAYWDTMKSLNQGPVFISSLLELDYEMGIFASATLSNPPFDATVFADIDSLRIRTETDINTAWVRDQKCTEEWLSFIDKRKKNNVKKPFFGFLFLDAVHAYSSENPGKGPFQPAWEEANYLALNNDLNPTKFFNLYKNVLHETDHRLGIVLNDLESKGLLDSTIVVLSGDHGEEFNDNRKNYWGHGGNFSKAQTNVPLVVYWPNKDAKEYAHTSLHYDIVPTLMSENLGCTNNEENYAIGKSLFDESKLDYYLVGAFENYGIVEDNRIINVNYSGNYSISDLNMNLLEDQSIDGKKFVQIFKTANRFYEEN